MTRFLAALLAVLLAPLALGTASGEYRETPYFAERVASGKLPPVAERVPQEPRVIELVGADNSIGQPGGRRIRRVPRGESSCEDSSSPVNYC